MRNLLRCRRGSVAFATVVALVPLIGVVALGAEAGTWYVTKQHAQNAADAAAYSGGLKLACSLAGSSCAICAIGGLSRQAVCGTKRFLQCGRQLVSRCPAVPSVCRRNVTEPSLIMNGASREFTCRPRSVSNSRRIWHQCLVCPPSI